jgi:putative ABC transport system ATP-binding protein
MMIRVRDLVMRLHGGGRPVTILDGVSLDVAAGECVAITGPSGSGKSTLLGLIAGLDQPTAGSITVDGVEIGRLDENTLARFRGERIGYVFQSYHLIPTLTALENVAVPLELAGRADAAVRARALLGEVGLADRADHYSAQLSGGEQQRVAVARAFAREPALLLADEPTGNLDSATGAQIIELILALQRERRCTLLLVTHDTALSRYADRVVTLRDGRIAGDARSIGNHAQTVTDTESTAGDGRIAAGTGSTSGHGRLAVDPESTSGEGRASALPTAP